MSEFRIETAEQEKQLTLSLFGSMDELSALPVVDPARFSKIILDFDGVTGINSLGIRTWMSWIEPLSRVSVELEFRRVRPAIIFQFNMVQGFFPANAKLKSVFIPMNCDRCDKQKTTLLDLKNAVSSINPSAVSRRSLIGSACKEEYCVMEPEYKLAQYLNFWNRKPVG